MISVTVDLGLYGNLTGSPATMNEIAADLFHLADFMDRSGVPEYEAAAEIRAEAAHNIYAALDKIGYYDKVKKEEKLEAARERKTQAPPTITVKHFTRVTVAPGH